MVVELINTSEDLQILPLAPLGLVVPLGFIPINTVQFRIPASMQPDANLVGNRWAPVTLIYLQLHCRRKQN